MSEHRYDKNIGSCVDPNPLRVERQDPDNFPRLQTRERCAMEIAAYVFKATCSKTCSLANRLEPDNMSQMRDILSASALLLFKITYLVTPVMI